MIHKKMTPSVLTTQDFLPEDVGVQANTLFIKILPISINISSDQIGRFLVTSSRRGKYIVVMAYYDSEFILIKPLKSRADADLLYNVTKLYKHLKESGLQPHLYMLNNKLSSLINYFISEVGGKHQLVPPGLHKALISEREIQIFKAHIIAGFSICNPNFPLHLCDQIIRQAELTLNLLHLS